MDTKHFLPLGELGSERLLRSYSGGGGEEEEEGEGIQKIEKSANSLRSCRLNPPPPGAGMRCAPSRGKPGAVPPTPSPPSGCRLGAFLRSRVGFILLLLLLLLCCEAAQAVFSNGEAPGCPVSVLRGGGGGGGKAGSALSRLLLSSLRFSLYYIPPLSFPPLFSSIFNPLSSWSLPSFRCWSQVLAC